MFDPKLESILDKGREFQAMGQHELALIFYKQSLQFYKDHPIYSLYINIEHAWCIEARGNYDEAHDEFLQLPS